MRLLIPERSDLKKKDGGGLGSCYGGVVVHGLSTFLRKLKTADFRRFIYRLQVEHEFFSYRLLLEIAYIERPIFLNCSIRPTVRISLSLSLPYSSSTTNAPCQVLIELKKFSPTLTNSFPPSISIRLFRSNTFTPRHSPLSFTSQYK